MIKLENISVLFIPLGKDRNQDVDVKDILHIIGDEFVTKLTWGVARLDWLGEESLPQQTDVAPHHRVLVSGQCLLELAEMVYETLEGYFVGYPSRVEAEKFLETGWPGSGFTTSKAEIAIQVLESSIGFVLYLRSKEIAERIAQHFQEVRWEDPAQHLVY